MQDPREAPVPPGPVDPQTLPPDLLELIGGWLPFRDRLAMASVCTRWRAALLPSEAVWAADLPLRLTAAKVASLALWLGLRPGAAPTSLALRGSGMPDDLLADHLAAMLGRRCDAIESISLTRVNLPAAAPFLLSFKNLAALDFGGGDLTLGADFFKLTALTSMSLKGRTMMFAPAPPSLRSLRLEEFSLPTPLGALLPGATALTSLVLRGVFFVTGVPWQAMAALWGLTALQDLTLSVLDATGWPRGVTRLTGLTRLDLSGTDIGDDGVASVEPLTALRELGLVRCRLGRLPAGVPPRLRRLAAHHNPRLLAMDVDAQEVSVDADSVPYVQNFVADEVERFFSEAVQRVAVHRYPGSMPALQDAHKVTRMLEELAAAPGLRRVDFWDGVLERSLTQRGAAALVALAGSGVQVEVHCDE